MKAFSLILLEDNETMMRLIDTLAVMDIAIALKYAECDLQDFFYSNMPLHKKQTIIELMSELDQISQEDSMTIQDNIVNELNKLKQ